MTPQPLAGLNATSRDPDLDPPPVQEPTAAWDVIGLVGMQLGRPFAPVTRWGADQWHRIDHLLEDLAVVAVGASQQAGQRNAVPIRDQVAFCAWLAPIGRVRTDRGAPLLAGMLALSTQARDQSIRSAAPSRSSSSR